MAQSVSFKMAAAKVTKKPAKKVTPRKIPAKKVTKTTVIKKPAKTKKQQKPIEAADYICWLIGKAIEYGAERLVIVKFVVRLFNFCV